MNDIRSKNQIDKLKIKRLKLILPIFLVIFVIFIILQYVSTKKVFVIDDSDISNYSKLTFLIYLLNFLLKFQFEIGFHMDHLYLVLLKLEFLCLLKYV